MVSKVKTVSFQGLNPIEITVESLLSSGLVSFSIVGLPDKAVFEAKERIRSTFYYMGLGFPAKRVTVNMAPADIPKAGSHYDLPIALSILAAMDVLDQQFLESILAIGELGLDGRLSYISGTLCCSLLANKKGYTLICPKDCEKEALWAGHSNVIAADSLSEIINHSRGVCIIPNDGHLPHIGSPATFNIDMQDVQGHEVAKRALEIAASGRHNVLMIGPPGSGKSMLAERIPTILPPLSPEEALETTCIYSVSGMVPEDGLIYNPPFRAPHHSASIISIVGGGSDAKPGELSLAHNGVLFLDELPEFQKAAIESLRQPLESNNITISRAKEHITYPANIQLVAAMNPCKCGYYGVFNKQCSRVPKCAQDYRNRISGPILDRFDIIIYVQNVPTSSLFKDKPREASAHIKKRVEQARQIQKARHLANKFDDYYSNSKIQSSNLKKILHLEPDAKDFFRRAIEKLDISTRSYHKILRVARTIADLAHSKEIKKNHISEAFQYRLLNVD